jgi:hypothetical protein
VTLHRRLEDGTYDVVVLVAPSSTRLWNRWPALAFVRRLRDR